MPGDQGKLTEAAERERLLGRIDQLEAELAGLRRQVEENGRVRNALHEAQERLRAVIEAYDGLIYICSPDLKVEFMNRQMIERTGRDAVGEYCYEALHDRDSVCPWCVNDRVAAGEVVRWETRSPKDGRWYYVVNSPLYNSDGTVSKLAMIQDITQRRTADIAVRESEERYRGLVELAPEAIFVNIDGKFTYMNPMAAKLFGLNDPEELYGRDVLDFIHPGYLDIVRERAANAREKGAVNPWLEEVYLRVDGSEVPVEVAAVPFSVCGRAGIQVIARDITERKKAQEEMLKAEQLESLGVLAGGIAHDFNNMLSGIVGNVTLAKCLVADGECRGLLEEAEQACMRASGLTKQLLTFSRGGVPVKKLVSLPTVVEANARFALSGSNVILELVADPATAVEVDEGQIGQVINNLVINAVQAMPEGGTLRIICGSREVEESSQLPLSPGSYTTIAVSDSGCGIPPALLPKIFDPYFTTRKGGSGLGLATVYSIVKRHQGHIAVESAPGQGTTFTVYLPATGEDAPHAGPPPERPAAGKGKVLVVDDNDAIRKSLAAMLGILGYRTATAEDGAEGVAEYRAALEAGDRFDAVLLDLTIPGGMGGGEAVKAILKTDRSAKVIVTSGYADDPVINDYRSYGFSGFITKPFLMDTLAESLAAVLEKRK